MRLIHFLGAALTASSLLAVQPGLAKAPAEEAARLTKDLTPVGAEKAGNKAGTIPEWTPMSQSGALKDFWPANPKIDAEKPVFTITAANMAQYAENLTAGHRELLKRYPDSYKINVYPTHRNATFPQEILDATVANATTATLEGVDFPSGATLGIPFPIPQSGAEAIWNHKLKYRGTTARRYNNQMIVQLDGNFTLTKIVEDVNFYYGNLTLDPPVELKPGIPLIKYVSETLSPPRLAGTFIVAHEKAGTGPEGRAAWLYAPALKRIRRAPAVCCDNPYEGTDGHQFYDQVDMFNGVLERFTWKLVGKREMFMPYNSHRIAGNTIKYDDIAHPQHVNPELPRFELHRAWVVEAENKPDLRHTFKKIVFYIDEDSWSIFARDNYDHQGELMQLQEGHLISASNVLTTTSVPEVVYHFNSGRYFVTAMANEDLPTDASLEFDDAYFEATSVQRRAAK